MAHISINLSTDDHDTLNDCRIFCEECQDYDCQNYNNDEENYEEQYDDQYDNKEEDDEEEEEEEDDDEEEEDDDEEELQPNTVTTVNGVEFGSKDVLFLVSQLRILSERNVEYNNQVTKLQSDLMTSYSKVFEFFKEIQQLKYDNNQLKEEIERKNISIQNIKTFVQYI